MERDRHPPPVKEKRVHARAARGRNLLRWSRKDKILQREGEKTRERRREREKGWRIARGKRQKEVTGKKSRKKERSLSLDVVEKTRRHAKEMNWTFVPFYSRVWEEKHLDARVYIHHTPFHPIKHPPWELPASSSFLFSFLLLDFFSSFLLLSSWNIENFFHIWRQERGGETQRRETLTRGGGGVEASSVDPSWWIDSWWWWWIDASVMCVWIDAIDLSPRDVSSREERGRQSLLRLRCVSSFCLDFFPFFYSPQFVSTEPSTLIFLCYFFLLALPCAIRWMHRGRGGERASFTMGEERHKRREKKKEEWEVWWYFFHLDRLAEEKGRREVRKENRSKRSILSIARERPFYSSKMMIRKRKRGVVVEWCRSFFLSFTIFPPLVFFFRRSLIRHHILHRFPCPPLMFRDTAAVSSYSSSLRLHAAFQPPQRCLYKHPYYTMPMCYVYLYI